MPIIQASNTDCKNEIIDLYIKTFSTGQSKQYIDITELNKYIDVILENGFSLLAIENEIVVGALLSCPLFFDKDIPPEIYNNFKVDNCTYVAEMMVAESNRGLGIGTKLLNEFFKSIDKSKFTDAFIRVWDENVGAISLYQKVGVEQIANIEQTKKKAERKGTFVMKNIYLHKKLV